jgi:endonuclease/exonuclease/phosphatase family metal-dependent hydrolase
VLVRTWNLFHGNTKPPARRAFLDEMIELATADDPDVLCVQEVPAWALERFTVGDVAARPSFGPVPIPRLVGRRLTRAHHGLIRSAFAGQGNAIQLSSRLQLLAHWVLTLNTRRFRDSKSRELGLDVVERLAWAKERRIVQAVRVSAADGRSYLIANMHCSSSPPDKRIPDAELLRAAWFATSLARPEDVVVLAGDFNVWPERSATLRALADPEWGFSPPGPGIDQVLVRGAASSPVRRWDDARRARGAVLLSDHTPVELDIS